MARARECHYRESSPHSLYARIMGPRGLCSNLSGSPSSLWSESVYESVDCVLHGLLVQFTDGRGRRGSLRPRAMLLSV